MADTAELAVRLTLDDRFSRSIRGASTSLSRFEGSVKRVGKGVGQIGSGFARAGLLVGGAAVSGLTAVAKAAIDFEDAFAGVRKTVDETDLQKAGLSFDKLARQFRDMATEIPIAATEFARIGEAAGALGIRAQDIDDFTRTVALLGVTTNLTTDQAAEDLGKIGTILGLSGKQFEAFADTLVNLGNKGASTETEIIEITKRFAASGKQAGLSTSQILAFASAIASAGAEPEAAGSSLSRLFGNLITDTALANKKGQAFARIAGKSFKDFSKIVKKDTVGAMLTFLKSLKGLNKFQQQKALKAVGITNVRDRNAILLLAQTYDTNLVPALKNAAESSGALSAEAQKRFDTTRAKLQLLANNIKEAAITIGEGFTPAIGRASEKLAAFLKQDANRKELKKLGEDIGRFIDDIDWQQVLSGLQQVVGLTKGAFEWAKRLFDAFNALPGPIKEAAAGFLVINKLSGGLVGQGVGNVVGGLAGAATRGAASQLPGVGKFFAQPVFVTNWPPGMGMPGGAPVPGGGKPPTAPGTVTPAIGAAVIISEADLKEAKRIVYDRLGRSLAGVVKELPARLNAGPRPQPNNAAQLPPGHDVQVSQDQLAAIKERTGLTAAAINALDPKLASVGMAVGSTAVATQGVIRGSSDANASRTVGAVQSSASSIVSAIWAARPIINVTNVTKTTTIQNRYGPGNGSYGGGQAEGGR